jgi:hypothetical protein
MAAARGAGGRAIRLAVSARSTLRSCGRRRRACARRSRARRFPARHALYANLTARPYEKARGGDPLQTDFLARSWQETVEDMIASGADLFVEVGPGAR